MSKTVVVTITWTPLDTAIIALEMRRFFLRSTPAFVWDNCAVGSKEQPRKIEASFPEKWKATK